MEPRLPEPRKNDGIYRGGRGFAITFHAKIMPQSPCRQQRGFACSRRNCANDYPNFSPCVLSPALSPLDLLPCSCVFSTMAMLHVEVGPAWRLQHRVPRIKPGKLSLDSQHGIARDERQQTHEERCSFWKRHVSVEFALRVYSFLRVRCKAEGSAPQTVTACCLSPTLPE